MARYHTHFLELLGVGEEGCSPSKLLHFEIKIAIGLELGVEPTHEL